MSTKHSGAGIGTESVRKITKKLGGIAEFSTKEDAFQAIVIFPLPQSD